MNRENMGLPPRHMQREPTPDTPAPIRVVKLPASSYPSVEFSRGLEIIRLPESFDPSSIEEHKLPSPIRTKPHTN